VQHPNSKERERESIITRLEIRRRRIRREKEIVYVVKEENDGIYAL
jgi:hypothetical protein